MAAGTALLPVGPVRWYRAGAPSGRAGSRDRRPPRRVPARRHRLGSRHDVLRGFDAPTAASSPATSSPDPQSVLLPALTGRAIRGLYYDDRSGLLWAVGNVIDGAVASGRSTPATGCRGVRGVRRRRRVPQRPRRHGDRVTSPTRAVDWLVGSRSTPRRGCPAAPSATLALSGAWPVSPRGNHQRQRDSRAAGRFARPQQQPRRWAVAGQRDDRSGDDHPRQGGPGHHRRRRARDRRDDLYNVRGSGPNQVSVLLLRQSGTGWTAKWAGARSDETLDVPSTATLAGGWLWVINARFGTPPPFTSALLDHPAPGEVAELRLSRG